MIWNNGSADGLWSTGTNWNTNAVPTGTDDVQLPLGLGLTITLSAGELANTLLFQDNYTLSGGNLTLTNGSITVDPTFSDTISSVLNGTVITKLGTGSLVLSGANTYTGLTSVTEGTLAYGASDVIATGGVTVDGNTAVLDLGLDHTDTVGTVILDNGGRIIGTGTSALTSTGTFEMKSGSVSAILGGSGIDLNKTTSGTVTLTGANTYTGSTTVNAGALFVNGSTDSGSAVTVNNSGTTLGGSGTINGSINVASSGANLSPGATGVGSTAILHTGAVTLAAGSIFNVDLNNTTAGTGYDQLSVTGVLNITDSNLVVTAGAGLSIGDKFFIALNDGSDAVTGTFAQGATVTSGADSFLINYLDNGDGGILGNDISLTVTAVPEPSTYIAGVLALGALAFHQRRRRFFNRGLRG